MTDLITIDPGVWACGVTLWTDRRLTGAYLAQAPSRDGLGWPVRRYPDRAPLVVLESMEYHPGRGRSVPQDLINVQSVGCLLAASLADQIAGVTLIAARDWMAQVPETILHARIQSLLDADELAIVDAVPCPAKNRKEVLDAAGIGLYITGRMRRGGGRA